MDLDEHTLELGKILVNLQSLEHLLRHFLYIDELKSSGSPSVDLSVLALGDVLPRNALTDYDSLRQLIDRFNSIVQSAYAMHVLDRTVVDLRDALAPGFGVTNLILRFVS